jgi:hypothetical protein
MADGGEICGDFVFTRRLQNGQYLVQNYAFYQTKQALLT